MRVGVAARSAFIALLSLAAAAGIWAAPAAGPTLPTAATSVFAPPDQIATHLATIRAAYDQILDVYVRPLAPATVLQPALDRLIEDSNAAGHSFTPPTLPSDREAAFSTFGDAYRAFAANASDADARAAAFAVMGAMTSALHDDHTGFLSPEELTGFGAQLSSSSGSGSGIRLNRSAPPFVQEVAPGGPADQAGLRTGDAIVAINGERLSGSFSAGQFSVLRGGAGPFTLRADRPGAGELDFSITPGPYSFPVWTANILTSGVGYMRLHDFVDPWLALPDGRSIDQAIDQSLEQFEAAGVQDWVLDLRGNPGGAGLLVDALAGRFIPDALVDRQFDDRGHQSQDITDGHLFRVQRPLALLIDRGSTSCSDLTASIMKESGRAILVGQRTGGAVANAVIWPVGEGAGQELTFADLHSGLRDAAIDHVGVPPDIEVPNRTAADYAAGRDPQLNAAVAALQKQDQTPRTPAAPDLVPLGRERVEALLNRYRPAASTLTAPPGISHVADLGGYTISSYNEYNDWQTATTFNAGSGGGRDAVATREAARSRGWLGGRVEVYGDDPNGTALWGEWDAYANAQGAGAALVANDFPDLWTDAAAPVELGDGGTRVEQGAWGDLGVTAIRWRHGSVVLTAEFQAPPGASSTDAAISFAQQIDAAYQQAQTFAFDYLLAPLERLLLPRAP